MSLLVLVLLPSVIGITAWSVFRLASAESGPPMTMPGPGPAPAEGNVEVGGSPPASGAAPALPAPAPSASPPPAINATEPNVEETEDPEQRPLIPTTMLADNPAMPDIDLDSFTAIDPRMYARSWRTYAGSRRSASLSGGGGGSGGGSGVGAQSSDGAGGGAETRIANLSTGNSDAGGQTQPEPTTPEPTRATIGDADSSGEGLGKGAGPKEDEPVAGGDKNPSDPLTALPDDLIDLIQPIGGSATDEGDAKPHVNVPEPSTLGLFGIALLGAALGRRKRL